MQQPTTHLLGGERSKSSPLETLILQPQSGVGRIDRAIAGFDRLRGLSRGSGRRRNAAAFDRLASDGLIGNQLGRWIALALAQVAVQCGLASFPLLRQAWADADDCPGTVAFRAFDLIAFAGQVLAQDAASMPTAYDCAADGGFGPDCDVVALHAKCVLVRSKGRKLEESKWRKNQTLL